MIKNSLVFLFTIDYALNFLPRNRAIVRINSPPMERCTEFTVCFWMSSSSSQGTPFSYTAIVGNSDRGLHIGYEKNQFALTINEEQR